MTQNIEQRTLAAAKLIEQSGLASHEYVTTESEHYTKPTGEKGLSVAGINNIALRTISSNQAAFDSQSKQNQTKFDTQDATQKMTSRFEWRNSSPSFKPSTPIRE